MSVTPTGTNASFALSFVATDDVAGSCVRPMRRTLARSVCVRPVASRVGANPETGGRLDRRRTDMTVYIHETRQRVLFQECNTHTHTHTHTHPQIIDY